MIQINQNPFRILGVPVTSTDRELERQYSNIVLYADMGKEIECGLDSIFSKSLSRDSIVIQEAKKSIELPHEKLFHATFWFWENSGNMIDDMAFEQIKSGNFEKAIQFWNKETEKGITSKNKSNFKNLSTFLLGLAIQNGKLDKFYFMSGLSLLGQFLKNEHFKEYANQVLDPKHSVSLPDTSNLIIDEILNSIKSFIDVGKSENKITNKEIFDCFKSFPTFLRNGILEKFIGGPIQNIEERIKTCNTKRKSGKSNDGDLGYNLWKDSAKDFKDIQSVLTKSDLKYQFLADKFAEELLGCSISHFNKNWNSNSDPGEVCFQLLKYAKSIAVGDKTKDRISDNQPTIEEYIANKPRRDKIKPVKNEMDYIFEKINELDNSSQATMFAKDAKDLLNNCKPKLDRIKNTLGSNDENFIQASDNVVESAISKCIELFNTAIRVSERADVDPSFMRVFGSKHIPEIVSVFNIAKTFSMSARVQDYYNRNHKILRIGEISGSNSDDGGCYIATMVYGSYDSPEVLVLRYFRDQVLLKNYIGKKFVKIYYLLSPKIVEKTKHLQSIHSLIRLFLSTLTKIINRIYA